MLLVRGVSRMNFFPLLCHSALNRNTRPTLKMFLRQLRLLRSGKRTARWFGPAAKEACNLYRLMLLLCRPRADLVRHNEEVAPA